MRSDGRYWQLTGIVKRIKRKLAARRIDLLAEVRDRADTCLRIGGSKPLGRFIAFAPHSRNAVKLLLKLRSEAALRQAPGRKRLEHDPRIVGLRPKFFDLHEPL
jgi:hypothetical protein